MTIWRGVRDGMAGITAVLTICLASAVGQSAAAAKTAPAGGAQVYRLTYTLTESDGGKKVGVQHYSVVVAEGGRTTLKNGSKVPVATGSYSTQGSPGAQTQFTYIDLGTNLDSTLSVPTDGTWQLKAKVEQSSVTEDKSIAGVNEPVIRQSVLEVNSAVMLGKPQVIGTLDFASSTRHLEVEVVMETVK